MRSSFVLLAVLVVVFLFFSLRHGSNTAENDRKTTTNFTQLATALQAHLLRPAGGEELDISADGTVVIDGSNFRRNARRLQEILQTTERKGKGTAFGGKALEKLHLRLVAKSIPSVGLLAKAIEMCGTTRLMVFHMRFLNDILESNLHAKSKASDPLDILMGVPATPVAVRRFFLGCNATRADCDDRGRAVRWLVGSPEDVSALSDVQRELVRAGIGLTGPLRVVVEVDVGLRRGGVSTSAGLIGLLRAISAVSHGSNTGASLQFGGLMAYVGHCTAAPALMGGVEACITEANQVLAKLTNAGKEAFPDLFSLDGIVINGGGSGTIGVLPEDNIALTEVSAGSILLKPRAFDGQEGSRHFEPALFLAGPVIKTVGDFGSANGRLSGEQSPVLVPFVPPWLWQLITWWDIRLARGIFVEGISMPGSVVVHPPGLVPNPILALADPGGTNLFPTQQLLHPVVGEEGRIDIGDLVFARPEQADAMLGYGTIAWIEAGRVEFVVPTYRGGI
jgi:hypothetical protein